MNAEFRFAGGGMSADRLGPAQMAGLGLPAPQVASSALTTWSVSADAVERWLLASKPDDRLIYAHGSLADAALAAQLRSLHDAGEVALRQMRSSADRAIDYVAIRLVPPPKAPEPPAVPDLYLIALLGRLDRAARRGLKCPTNLELANELGLRRPQVAWRMRQLVEDGKIATRIEPHHGPSPWRVVTILATGRETAAPPAMRGMAQDGRRPPR